MGIGRSIVVLLLIGLKLAFIAFLIDHVALPVAAGAQMWPATRLEPKHPRLAYAWLIATTPLYWGVMLAWALYTVWETRIFGIEAIPWLWPLFIFVGWSSCLYPIAKATRETGEGGLALPILTLIWAALMIAAFYLVHPAKG